MPSSAEGELAARPRARRRDEVHLDIISIPQSALRLDPFSALVILFTGYGIATIWLGATQEEIV